MNEMVRKYATDETFREVANLLFGGGADDLVSKLSPEQKKERTDKIKNNIALATNAGGAIAGPAAIYGAYKGRKQGGFFRDVGRSGKVGSKAKKVAETLDKPVGRKAKIAAAAAGGTMVGLQGLNMAGDTIAAQTFSQKKKEAKKQPVAKGLLTPISKSEPGSSDVYVPSTKMGRRAYLAEKAGKKAQEKAPTLKKGALKAINETPELSAKVKQYTKEKKEKLGKSVTWEGEISKVDTDKRQVFGWASIVEMNGEPVVDLQGDYIDHDELEKSAYDYVIKSRKGGNMHLRDGDQPVHVSDMIESFLVTPEKKEALGLPDEMPTGWWVGYQINDDEAWNLVKSGKRTGFSIHGRGQRTPTEM